MRHIGMPTLFRRRSGGKKSAARAHDVSGAFPSVEASRRDEETAAGRVTVVPATRAVGIANIHHGASATVSTLSNDRQEVSMQRSEALLEDAEQGSTTSVEPAYNGDVKAVGIDHLSLREQMWYKNQLYLLEKQRKESASAHRPYNGQSSMDRHAAGISKNDSPIGVDQFEPTDGYKRAHCESRREIRFRSGTRERSSDTGTHQSSSLYTDDDTRTNQTSTVLDDDTRTNQSSSMLYDDASESNFDDVTLGSTTLEGGRGNAEESLLTSLEGEDSLFASLEDGTSMSYLFEFKDEGKRPRKYQLGVGQSGRTTKPRKENAKPSPKHKDASARRNVAAQPPRRRTGKGRADERDFADNACPLIPDVLEEMRGWRDDATSALSQVMCAFFISPDDIDRVSDKLRDAKVELAEMYREQANERRNDVRFA